MNLHSLMEDQDGTDVRIGGAMTGINIGSVNGPLSELSVEPVPVEEMREELYDSAIVRLKLGDRVTIFDDPRDIDTLIELLEEARRAGLRNLQQAFPPEMAEWTGTGLVPDHMEIQPGSIRESQGPWARQ